MVSSRLGLPAFVTQFFSKFIPFGHQLFNYQKADDKIYVCKFSKKIKSKLYHIEKSKTRGQNSVDLDEVAHYEPPYQDLRCLHFQLSRLWWLKS